MNNVTKSLIECGLIAIWFAIVSGTALVVAVFAIDVFGPNTAATTTIVIFISSMVAMMAGHQLNNINNRLNKQLTD